MGAGGRDPYDEPLPRIDDLPTAESHAVWEAMAESILSSETPAWGNNGKPMITYHPTAVWLPDGPPAIASAFFPNAKWLAFDGCQSGHADYPNLPFRPAFGWWDSRSSHVARTEMWNNSIKPILDLESHYEDAHNALDARQKWKWTADDIRAGAWQSMLSGACGVVYGANAVWQMYDPERRKIAPHIKPVCGLDAHQSWQKSIQLPGPSQVQILTDFMLSLPPDVFHHRQPAQSMLVSSEAPADRAQRDARVDIMGDVYDDQPSTTIIAHSGFGSVFQLDFATIEDLRGEWFDPRTGKRTELGQVEAGARVQLTPPSSGGVAHDWVLVLTRVCKAYLGS